MKKISLRHIGYGLVLVMIAAGLITLCLNSEPEIWLDWEEFQLVAETENLAKLETEFEDVNHVNGTVLKISELGTQSYYLTLVNDDTPHLKVLVHLSRKECAMVVPGDTISVKCTSRKPAYNFELDKIVSWEFDEELGEYEDDYMEASFWIGKAKLFNPDNPNTKLLTINGEKVS